MIRSFFRKSPDLYAPTHKRMAFSCKRCSVRHKAVIECPDCLSQRDPTEFSALKELRTASDLIASLREEKNALKVALRTALNKNEELHDKTTANSLALKDEIRRRKAVESEFNRAKAEFAHFDLKVSESKALLQSREQELQRLEHLMEVANTEVRGSSLEAANRTLKAQVKQLKQQLEERMQVTQRTRRRIDKYCSFINAKLHELPDYLILFRGRFKRSDDMKALDDEENILKVLQFLADLLMYEAQKPRPSRKDRRYDEEVSNSREESTPWQQKSVSKSIQTQSDKATSTSVSPPITPYATSLPFGSSPMSLPRFKGDDLRTSILGRDSAVSYLYRHSETPKAQESPFKEATYSAGLSDTSSLIEALSFQNEKLNKLNQQIAETMASSRNLLNTSRNFDNRSVLPNHENRLQEDLSSPSEQRHFTAERAQVTAGGTQDILGIAVTETLSEGKVTMQTASDLKSDTTEIELPGVTEFLQPQKTDLSGSAKPSKPIKSNSKPGSKIPATKPRVLKTMPVLHKSDGWKSVKEFFGRSEDEDTTEQIKFLVNK